jgi:hypothetical protein
VGVVHDSDWTIPASRGVVIHECGYLEKNREWNFTWVFSPGVAAVMDSFTLKVYNYTLYSDHLYFTSSAFLNNADTLSHIRFFSENGISFIGNSLLENSLSGSYQVRPEPETYATAALLLIGLGIYAYRRRQSI